LFVCKRFSPTDISPTFEAPTIMNFTHSRNLSMLEYSSLFMWQVQQAVQRTQQMQMQMQQAQVAQYNQPSWPRGNQQTQQIHMQQAPVAQYNPPRRRRRRRGKAVASTNNNTIHASHNTITNGDRVISHHNVGVSNNARSGSRGPPPVIAPTPDLESLRRAALATRGKRSQAGASSIKAARKCDELPKDIVTTEGVEFDRPRKRARLDDQSTTSTSQASVASTSTSI